MRELHTQPLPTSSESINEMVIDCSPAASVEHYDAINAREHRAEMVFVPLVIASKAKKLIFSKFGACTLAGVAIATPAILGGMADKYGAHATADMNKALTQSESTLLAFNENRDLSVATSYAKEKFSALNISYNVDFNIPVWGDVVPDFPINKELNGVLKADYDLPFTAFKRTVNPSNGKTDFTVDRSKMTADVSWIGIPESHNFLTDGKTRSKNEDGFKANAVKNIANAWSTFRVDVFNDTIKQLDQKVIMAMSNMALKSYGQKCSPELQPELDEAVRNAVKDNLETLAGQDPSKIGEFIFQNKYVLNEKPLPDIVDKAVKEVYENNGDRIKVDKNFQVDEVKCYMKEMPSQAPVQ